MIEYEKDEEYLHKYVEALNYIESNYYDEHDSFYCVENDTEAFMDLANLVNDYRKLEKAFKVACGKLKEYNYAIYGLYRLTNKRNSKEWEEWCYTLANE